MRDAGRCCRWGKGGKVFHHRRFPQHFAARSLFCVLYGKNDFGLAAESQRRLKHFHAPEAVVPAPVAGSVFAQAGNPYGEGKASLCQTAGRNHAEYISVRARQRSRVFRMFGCPARSKGHIENIAAHTAAALLPKAVIILLAFEYPGQIGVKLHTTGAGNGLTKARRACIPEQNFL